jgi:hypothetical protein
MKVRKTILLSVLVLLGAVFSMGWTTSDLQADSDQRPQIGVTKQRHVVEDYVVYGSVFHRVDRLKEKTRELQSQRRISQTPYFGMKKDASLTDEQAMALDAIAAACQKQVRDQDEKAKKIIADFQTKFPGGRVPSGGSPPPPPELKTMWIERNSIILRFRDQLHAAFGDEAFARFDNYAKYTYGANTVPVTLKPLNAKKP